MGIGKTCRNDANVRASPRIHDHEQAAHRTYADCDESFLVRIGFVIRDGDGVRIVENRIASGMLTPCLR